jgi:threonine/homoserine/homoserine lactone efflux protein
VDRGWAYGFLSGAGVATADASYAAIAAFGLTAVTGALVGIDRLLGIAGGAILVVMAVRALRAAPPGPAAATPADPGRLDGPAAAYASMVGLTLTNPATILSFVALFASIGAGTGGPAGAVVVVTWWAILTGLVAGLRTRLSPGAVRGLNVASALMIGAFGVAAIGLGIAG